MYHLSSLKIFLIENWLFIFNLQKEPAKSSSPAPPVAKPESPKNYIVMPEPGFSVPKKSPPKSPVQTDADSAPIEKLESDIEFDDEQLPKIEFTESGCKKYVITR